MAVSSKRRAEIIEEVGKCEQCGDENRTLPGGKANLIVHHLKEVCEGGTDDRGNLAVRCKTCHGDEHKTRPREKRVPVSERPSHSRRAGTRQLTMWLPDEVVAKLDSLIPALGRTRTSVLVRLIRRASDGNLTLTASPFQGQSLEALAARIAALEAERNPPLESE